MEFLEEELDPKDLPFDLTPELGTIVSAGLVCSGVYYLSAKHPTLPEMRGLTAQEYYVVTADSPAVSDRARSYGQRFPGHPDLTVHLLEGEQSGWHIVSYDIARYLKMTGSEQYEDGAVRDTAVYGMETNPEYFGAFPAPLHTPMGRTLRYQELANGIIWLETDQCEEMIAICYPIWVSDLSAEAKLLGLLTEYDAEHGVNNTMGYLFFTKQASCVPIYDLLLFHREWETDGTINKAALMNAIWTYYPDYAAHYNATEQSGGHDYFGQMLNALGAETELKCVPQYLIKITEGAGTEFYSFLDQWKVAPAKEAD